MSEPKGPVTAEEAAWLAWRNDPRPLGWAIPVEERAFKDGYRAARADALAEIRAKVARMAEAPSDLSAESLFRRDGWADVLALLDPLK